MLIVDASHHPRADPTTAWATTDGSTPNADASTYRRRLGSSRPFCEGSLSERILSKTRTVKEQHEMICRIAATNGKANGSWCSEAKEPVSTSIKTALATPTKTAARPMKAETSVRAIVVDLPSIFFSAAIVWSPIPRCATCLFQTAVRITDMMVKRNGPSKFAGIGV